MCSPSRLLVPWRSTKPKRADTAAGGRISGRARRPCADRVIDEVHASHAPPRITVRPAIWFSSPPHLNAIGLQQEVDVIGVSDHAAHRLGDGRCILSQCRSGGTTYRRLRITTPERPADAENSASRVRELYRMGSANEDGSPVSGGVQGEDEPVAPDRSVPDTVFRMAGAVVSGRPVGAGYRAVSTLGCASRRGVPRSSGIAKYRLLGSPLGSSLPPENYYTYSWPPFEAATRTLSETGSGRTVRALCLPLLWPAHGSWNP